MDNSLPSDPPDRTNNPNSIPPASNPPPFGSGFNPHTNPINPNNPYQTQPQPSIPNPSNAPLSSEASAKEDNHPTHSDVAKHRQRDSHGHFIPYEQSINPNPQTIPAVPIAPNQTAPSNPPILPPLVETNPKENSKDSDPPIFTIRNPIIYIKKWWNRILAKEGVDFKLGFKIRPITAILIASIIISGGVSSGITALVLKTFWPTSSPVLHRQIVEQGIIQKSATGGFYLTAQDQSIWKLKPKNLSINFNDQIGKQVTVTGNMTKEPNLIEVSEIILPETGSPQILPPQTTPKNLNNAPNGALPNIPNQDLLPKLYSGLQWDLTQRKVLIFTSGKRKIEQEGVYMESVQLTDIPQDFLNYYIGELINAGFKETLNSSDSNGQTVTFAKDDLFLTFGVKNIYKGSDKLLVGYKAYLEHN